MWPHRTTRRKSLQRLHRDMVLAQIARRGPLSRKSVSETLNLRLPTVNEHVKALLTEGYLVERPVQTVRRGRRPGQLVFNGAARTVIGVLVRGDSLWVTGTDLKGEARLPSLRRDARYATARGLRSAIASAVRTHLKKTNRKDVLGVGIAVPGLVDRERGISLAFVKERWWRNVALAQPLSKALGLPVYVENDTNATALVELWFGRGTDGDDFLFVELSDGVGATLVRKGDLEVGAFGSAGEMGHMTIDMNGRKCSCGGRGCLETVVGIRPLLKDAGIRTPQSRFCTQALDRLWQRAESGRKRALAAIGFMGRALGVGLASVVNFAEPGRVILYGDLVRLAPFFEAPMREAFRTNVLVGPRRETEIRFSQMGEDAAALGAAALVVHKKLHIWERTGA